MARSNEFYERTMGINYYEVQKYLMLLEKIESGNYTENEVRALGERGLKVCLSEGKYDLFKKLVKPFAFKDSKGNKYYKYLLDAISLGLVEYIKNAPESIMSAWVKLNQKNKWDSEELGEKFYPVPVEYAAKYSVILYPSLKKELLDAIYKVDRNKIMTIKIKDVLARQISGIGHPIRTVEDVIYYAETPVLYPCIDLFNKNVVTIANDTGGCYDDVVTSEDSVNITNIVIDYESLDEDNKIVADTLVLEGYAKYVNAEKKGLSIEVLCRRYDTVYNVNSKFMELVSKFHKQDMLYGVISKEEIEDTINEYYGYLPEYEKGQVDHLLNNGYTGANMLEMLKYFTFINYYYDSNEDKFWLDKSYYDRHKKYLEEQPNYGKGLK